MQIDLLLVAQALTFNTLNKYTSKIPTYVFHIKAIYVGKNCGLFL